MPRGVDDEGRRRRSYLDGQRRAMYMGIALVLIVLLLVGDPKLVSHNPVTAALGASTPMTPTTTTTDPSPTTTTAPPSPTTTTTTDPSPTTTTAPPSPTTTDPPPATSTTVVPYVAPSITATVEPGSFGAEAQVVSATYPFTTSGGVVTVTGTWSGGVDLTLSVQCGSAAPTSSAGPSGLSVTATCPAGPVTVGASEQTEATVSYSLSIEYPRRGG